MIQTEPINVSRNDLNLMPLFSQLCPSLNFTSSI